MPGYLSSGVKALDGILGGGMLPGNSYLLEVEPGAQELAFIAPFLSEGLRQGNFCMLLLFDMPHDDVINKLIDLGVDIRMALESGSAVIADLWSEGKYDHELKGPILMSDNLNDPNSVLRMYYDLAEMNERKLKSGNYTGARVVVMSMSSQIMNYRFEPSYKMNRLGVNLIRQRKLLSLCMFSPSMFDQTVVAAFEHLNDGIIVLSLKETRGRFQRFIRVKQSPIPGFFSNEVPYTIVDNRPYLVTTFTEPLSTFRDHVKVEADGSVSLFGSRCIIVDTAIIRSLIEYLTKRASFDIKGAQEEVYNFSKEYGRELLKGFLISTNLRMEDLGSKALFDMFTAFLSTSGVGLLRVGKFSDNLITMKVFNCICGSNQAISQAISPYLRGIIAGVAETLLDGRFKCSETKCMASNEDYCEFECQRLE